MRFMLMLMSAGLTLTLAVPASAQDGCRVSQRSCSEMNATCESNCQKASNNPSACIARSCSQNLVACKANGVWKGAAASACWRTHNRS